MLKCDTLYGVDGFRPSNRHVLGFLCCLEWTFQEFSVHGVTLRYKIASTYCTRCEWANLGQLHRVYLSVD